MTWILALLVACGLWGVTCVIPLIIADAKRDRTLFLMVPPMVGLWVCLAALFVKVVWS